MALQVQAAHVSRRNLVFKRDEARAELKELRCLREAYLEELNLAKASRDSLQISLDETDKKLKDAAGVIETLN